MTYRQRIHALLTETVEQHLAGADRRPVDVDAEVDRVLTALPAATSVSRDDLRVHLARLATDRGLPVLMAPPVLLE